MSAVAGVETEIKSILQQLGVKELNSGASTGSYWFNTRGTKIESFSPVDGKLIATVHSASETDYEATVMKAQEAFLEWRLVLANNFTAFRCWNQSPF